jgi:parallel beta-helix repeat protein
MRVRFAKRTVPIVLAGLLVSGISAPALAGPSKSARINRLENKDSARAVCSRTKPRCRKDGPKPASNTPEPASTPSPTSTPAPEPTPAAGSCSGTQLSAGANLAAAISGAPANATFCLASGTYVISSPLRPKNGQAFVAVSPRTAVLTGNDSTSMAFNGEGIADVAVKGLVIEHFDTPAQGGLAALKTGTGWVVEGNEIRDNAALGLYHESNTRILNNFIHHNGQMGISAYQAVDAVVEGNEISFNNTKGFDEGSEGGSKWTGTVNLVVRDNYFHDNYGTGLWVDGDNLNVLLENNRSVNNDGKGIYYEISCAGTIRNNVAENNTHSGLELVASQNVEVYGNTFKNNGYGIRVWQQVRGSGPNCQWVLKNISIHDNSITMTTGYTGLERYGSGTSDAVFSDGTVRFANNTYTLAPGGKYFHWMNNLRTVQEWKGYGQDTGGTFN